MIRRQPDDDRGQGFGDPDMVVPSAEGSRWGELGRRLTPEQRENALESLLVKLNRSSGPDVKSA